MERKRWLASLVKYVFSKIAEDEEIFKLINEKESMPMEDWIERMKVNRKKEDRKLVKDTIMEIVKNMLKANQDDNTIIKFTNVKKEDIDQIRKKLEMQVN